MSSKNMEAEKNMARNRSAQQERGFTLVELSLVIVIIGLIIGGILKGYEVVQNAQMASVLADVNRFDAAAQSFRFKYGYLPGDLPNPMENLPNCPDTSPASLCEQTTFTVDGNGRIMGVNAGATIQLGDFPATGWFRYEELVFFVQLAGANMLDGLDPTSRVQNVAQYGIEFPASGYKGGYRMGYSDGTPTSVSGNTSDQDGDGNADGTFLPGYYVVYVANPSQPVSNAAANILLPAQAAIIDGKSDDGNPNAGKIRAGAATPANCVNGNTYNQADGNPSCSLYIKFLEE